MSGGSTTGRSARWDLALTGIALIAGLLFFGSLDRLWPLAEIDLEVPGDELEEQAREFLELRGFDLAGYASADWLTVNGSVLDYAEASFGREQTQSWIAAGLPIFRYRTYFKKAGDPTYYVVDLHPGTGILGWSEHLEEDTPGQRIEVEAARSLAVEAISNGLRLDVGAFEERSAATTERPERRDHTFWYEREVVEQPELRERIRVVVAGDRVAAAGRSLALPGEARRSARAAEAPSQALEIIGFVLVGVGVLAGYFIFLRQLQDGTIDLRRAAVWPTAVFVCLIANEALQTADVFAFWEPLWPRWVSSLRYIVYRSIGPILIALVLLTMVGAGDALDRLSGSNRGRSLALLGRGRVLDASVARASRRGFLVGLICGGVMVLAVVVLQWLAGSTTALQPRGFFFYPLNSAAPAVTSLLFFLGVALGEELGYRFFGGTWLLSWTRSRWIAVIVPAVIYGLTHTRLDFLPPAEPFWGRALVLTLVGCVWGWAFLRYDALTVVLSHFTADLFIFNWPRLAGDDPRAVVVAAIVMFVPLFPALLRPLAGLFGLTRRDMRA